MFLIVLISSAKTTLKNVDPELEQDEQKHFFDKLGHFWESGQIGFPKMKE
jgi:hypothetical protein